MWCQVSSCKRVIEQDFPCLRNFVHFFAVQVSQMCDRAQESKLDTRLKNFYLIYEIYASKNKGELVECRLCLEDTMPACFTNYIIDSEQYDYFLLSCIGVDSTFCCSKVKYSLLLKVTEFFTAVPPLGS